MTPLPLGSQVAIVDLGLQELLVLEALVRVRDERKRQKRHKDKKQHSKTATKPLQNR